MRSPALPGFGADLRGWPALRSWVGTLGATRWGWRRSGSEGRFARWSCPTCPNAQPPIIRPSYAPTHVADDPAGGCEYGPQGGLAPVRIDVAPRRRRAAVCGDILALTLYNSWFAESGD